MVSASENPFRSWLVGVHTRVSDGRIVLPVRRWFDVAVPVNREVTLWNMIPD